MPEAIAVVEPLGYDRWGRRRYRQVTFQQLDADSSLLARGLAGMGAVKGMRLALLVRPGIDFVSLVFALLKAGAVAILIDPDMGKRNLVRCLAEADPQGFVAVTAVHAVRTILRRKFPSARFNVTVGRRWFWGGKTLEQLRHGRASQPPISPFPSPVSLCGVPEISLSACESPNASLSPWGREVRDEGAGALEQASTVAEDPAAIIFTTGSTGPPKGVLYTHGNFDAQVEQIRDFYGIRPGEVDLPGFPLFGLFNCAMGVTTVIPDMDPSRPAQVDPAKIIEAVRDWKVTQTFGSPAIWDRVGRYCEEHRVQLPTVRRVLSAGAPVPSRVLRRMKACIHAEGEVHTPYGATEALPVASIAASEILRETSARTVEGAGVCVGRRFPGIQWKILRIVDGPIRSMQEAEELPAGRIGELVVRGPQVTRCYVTRAEANALGKIPDGSSVWHRMGDAGYLDQQDRFWFCGRLAHRVLTRQGPLYTIPCEAIFNRHPDIHRSALVGIGSAGNQRPVIVLEPWAGRMPSNQEAEERLLEEIRRLGKSNPETARIEDFLLHPAFPVDIRHNAKIFREKLAAWAAGRLERAES
jgi:acyl-CoA synthetase (AMP-forming)/AMP-acid ligase II